ncbi:hypothetical protein COTS27_01004 [Spirochaetota bacterium]|nr:hypothetical protein COTS27_01004 [Spirochaetota bacterium]
MWSDKKWVAPSRWSDLSRYGRLRYFYPFFCLSKIFTCVFGVVIFGFWVVLSSCVVSAGSSAGVGSVGSPLEIEDIELTASGGDATQYGLATVMIEEESLIVISNIINLPDANRSETLTLSIIDKDSPAKYKAEPERVTILETQLNPIGTGLITNTLEQTVFRITPLPDGKPVIYRIELRLDEYVMRTPLRLEDITFASGNHPAYKKVVVLSINDNIVTMGGIKNKEPGFSEDLILMIKDTTDPSEYEIIGGSTLTLPGTSLNPPGITNIITRAVDEELTFTVVPTAVGSEPVKYYIQLVLGDLVQVHLLGGKAGDVKMALLLSEGTSSIGFDRSTIVLTECGVFPPSYEVLVGGVKQNRAAYRLTARLTGMSPSTINVYEMGTYSDISLVLSEDNVEIETFASLTVMTTALCTAAGLFGTGIENDPFIINNDRRLDLISRSVNARSVTPTGLAYADAYYRITEPVDLGRRFAPWSEIGSSGGVGFSPIGIGTGGVYFMGRVDCQGNEIANLYINRRANNVGLFGYVLEGVIENCGLTNVNVTGRNTVGGLVGYSSRSTIVNSYVTGVVTGTNELGGLIGYNDASMIGDCHATADVMGMANNIGGLVGYNDNASAITRSYTTGAVTGRLYRVGGLVGYNSGSMINDSYAAGVVLGRGNDVGGLVGYNSSNATITRSYAAGAVTGMASNVGGLVGYSSGSMIADSYAMGNVLGNDEIGGLVGYNNDAKISDSYAIGDVMGNNGVGGLVGRNYAAMISTSYAVGAVTGTGANTNVGLFIGYNNVQSNLATPGYDTVVESYYNSDAVLMVRGSVPLVKQGIGFNGAEIRANQLRSRTTVQFQRATAATTGWDDSHWLFEPVDIYPRLKRVVCANRQYSISVPTTCTDL